MDNRENILRCATELFYKKGYEAVSVREIVDAAGITKPTLYYYFKSKYGLLECLLKEKCNKLCVMIEEAIEKKEDFTVSMINIANTYINFGAGDIHFFHLIISMQYSPKESDSYKAVEPYTTKIFENIKKEFEYSENLLGNMRGRQEQFAIGFIGIMNYYLLVCSDKNADSESFKVSKDEIYSIVHQFLHGIYS